MRILWLELLVCLFSGIAQCCWRGETADLLEAKVVIGGEATVSRDAFSASSVAGESSCTRSDMRIEAIVLVSSRNHAFSIDRSENSKSHHHHVNVFDL